MPPIVAKLLAGAVSIALACFVVIMFGSARYHEGELAERNAWTKATAVAATARDAEHQAGAKVVIGAVEHYAAAEAALQPIIVRSTDTVREYAQSDAGRAPCLGIDRVRGIEANAANLALFTPSAAVSVAGAVPADTVAGSGAR